MSTKHNDRRQYNMAKQWWQGSRYVLLVLSTIGLAGLACGQPTTRLDSLIAELDTAQRDTLELIRLGQVCDLLYEDPRGAPYLQRYGALVQELLGSGIPAVVTVAEEHQTSYLNLYALDQMQRQNYVRALRTFERALALHTARSDADGIVLIHNNIGWLHENAGDAARAIVAYKKALDVVRREAVSDWSPTSLMSHIGSLFTEIGALDSAEFYLEQGLAGTDSLTYAHDHSCMGQLREAQGRYEEAFQHCTSSRDAALRQQNHQLFFAGSYSLSRVYTAMNRPELAAAMVDDMVARARAIGNDRQLSRAHLLRGKLRRERGALVAAEEDLRTALSLARTNGYLGTIVNAAGELRDLYAGRANYKEAFAMMVEMTTAADSMRNKDARSEVLLREFRAELAADSLASAQEAGRIAVEHQAQVSRERTRRNIFLFAGLGLLVFGVVIFRQRNRIKKEHQRSEELLLNILPEEVAAELKAKGEAAAQLIEQVTVLFTDFKGFTEMSEKLTAKELVADIHECFSAFDRIMEKHGIEKIKTIGDAYMAAGGLPTPNSTHAVDVVKAALEICDFISEGKVRKLAAGLPYFEIRIGVHTGPVVAGIVGVKKFAYDIWGDTVNTASRMESSGEVGQVNISEATYDLVKDATASIGTPAFLFTPRGKVQAKGKGEMEMYFVSSTNSI